MKIAVLGYIVRGPLGGLAWHHFQYVYGLLKMGHQVLFLEDSEDYPACYNPEIFQMTTDPTYGLNFISELFSRFNISENWTYFDFHTNQWFGRKKPEIFAFLNESELLINLSGVNPLREWFLNIPRKILIDTDPVFTQVKHLTRPEAMETAKLHDVFFTFGENFGKSGCFIPDDTLFWLPTRQPIVGEIWGNIKNGHNNTWTTIMQWDSYKTVEWNGKTFGMKSGSFQPYINLPSLLPENFELAIGSVSAPKRELEEKGWKIVDPLVITKTPATYQEYIGNSKGEWGIAKHGYVVTNSGWFSERSAAYLAAGKPVVVQDTGFSDFIHIGQGLFSFNNVSELKEIFLEIEKNYEFHNKKAREICWEYFDHEKVLNRLLENI